MTKKTAGKLAARLASRLTPETDRQPPLKGQAWQIEWQHDLGSTSTIPVGCLLLLDGRPYWRTLDHDALALLGTDEAVTLQGLLDALRVRLSKGELSPPPGIILHDCGSARGDNTRQILDYLWKHGPAGWLKKKALSQHDKGFFIESEPATHSQPHKAMASRSENAAPAPEPDSHATMADPDA